MRNLNQEIEALIFSSETSISIQELQLSIKNAYDIEISEDELYTEIASLMEKYRDDSFAFEILEVAGGFQFMTKPRHYPVINALLQHKAKKRLSTAALETLSIIAYRQPISKSEMEHIRGVSCDYSVQKLLEKELVEIVGRSEGPGKPVLYGTSKTFMDYFGLKSVKELPQLKDIQVSENEIGQNPEA